MIERVWRQRVREYELETGERLAKWERWGRESRETEECFFVSGGTRGNGTLVEGQAMGRASTKSGSCLGVQSPVLNVFLPGEGIQE